MIWNLQNLCYIFLAGVCAVGCTISHFGKIEHHWEQLFYSKAVIVYRGIDHIGAGLVCSTAEASVFLSARSEPDQWRRSYVCILF